jgi:hypothetical protein
VVNKPDLLFFGKGKDYHSDTALERSFTEKYYADDELSRSLNLEMLRGARIPSDTIDQQFFAEGLRLDLFVGKLLQPKYAAGYIFQVLANPSTDLEVILERQSAEKELLESPEKVEFLEDTYRRLWEIAGHVWQRSTLAKASTPWTSGLMPGNTNQDAQLFAHTVHLLGMYQDIVQELGNKIFTSGPLRQVADLAKEIEKSSEYKELGNYLHTFSNQREYRADVSVTVNAVGGYSGMNVTRLELNTPRRSKKEWREDWSTYAILKHITELYTQNSKNLKALIHLVGDLEFYTCGARYAYTLTSKKQPTCLPTFNDKVTQIHDLISPLLLLLPGGNPVPIDLELTYDSFGRVITGPNNGGKSVSLRAVGLAYTTGQNGWIVPGSSANLSLINGLYTHFPTRDDVEGGKGSFLGEMEHDRRILDRANSSSLVLLDEPCIGTEPSVASVQTGNFVEYMGLNHIPFLIATHMHDVALDVKEDKYPGVTNLQAEVKFEGNRPHLTYKIIPEMAGQSYGEAVARQAGVDRESLGLPPR